MEVFIKDIRLVHSCSNAQDLREDGESGGRELFKTRCAVGVRDLAFLPSGSVSAGSASFGSAGSGSVGPVSVATLSAAFGWSAGAAGSQFAAALDNGLIQLWDCRMGRQPESEWSAHSGPVFALDWHPFSFSSSPSSSSSSSAGSCALLASAGRDRSIHVWQVDRLRAAATDALLPLATIRVSLCTSIQSSICTSILLSITFLGCFVQIRVPIINCYILIIKCRQRTRCSGFAGVRGGVCTRSRRATRCSTASSTSGTCADRFCRSYSCSTTRTPSPVRTFPHSFTSSRLRSYSFHMY